MKKLDCTVCTTALKTGSAESELYITIYTLFPWHYCLCYK